MLDLVLKKLKNSFPQMYINDRIEAIIHPRNNIYFRLEDCHSEEDVIRKILCWLSRPAHKSESLGVRRYLQEGINHFLGEEFTREDMARIYTQLGNGVNEILTNEFMRSGYNMALLKALPSHIKPYYQGE
jgi:hypothetical protein